MTPLEKARTQDYYNWYEDQLDDKKIQERRRKFIRDREKCNICLFVDYIKSFFF
jgi:hypothetical protein